MPSDSSGSVRSMHVTPYQLAWAEEAARVPAALKLGLHQKLGTIEHFGGTSLPGVASQPVIDIMADVDNEVVAEACENGLAELGYLPRLPDFPMRQLALFERMPTSANPVGVHLYLLPRSCEAWHENQLFRDYLRRRPELAQAYGGFKENLAIRFGGDPSSYAKAKAEFIAATVSESRFHI